MNTTAGQMRAQAPFVKSTHAKRTAATKGVCVAQPLTKKQISATIAGAAALSSTLLAAPALAATEAVSNIADGSTVSLALGGGAAIAALSAALIATDPQKRRAAQMEETGGNELEAVKNYFNTAKFTAKLMKLTRYSSIFAKAMLKQLTRCLNGLMRKVVL